MVTHYRQEDIDSGELTEGKSGHKVYYGAKVRTREQGKVIYKLNKKEGKPIYSSLEAAFSAVAKLYVRPNGTPDACVVTNQNNQVEGIAIEHIEYPIKKREGNKKYYTYPNWEPNDGVKYYFLEKLGEGFFADLRNNENIEIDMESLASVLTASYTLEEDDLHKGNVGVYFVDGEGGKKRAVFFKIDHDLMFTGKIMAHLDSRFQHKTKWGDAYKITEFDLRNFPDIRDSMNFYWPTRFHLTAKGEKQYGRHFEMAEINAFKGLKKDPEFNKAKWHEFCRHLLIPKILVEHVVDEHLDQNNPEERQYRQVLVQSTLSISSDLRYKLVAMPEFRNYVLNEMNPKEKETLINEIVDSAPDVLKHSVRQEVEESMNKLTNICKFSSEDDTPLHTAIRTGNYKYDETLKDGKNKKYLNQLNEESGSPLDLAIHELRMAKLPEEKLRLRMTIAHLIESGAKITDRYRDIVSDGLVDPGESFVSLVAIKHNLQHINSIDNLEKRLDALGNDASISLAVKKSVASKAIHEFINLNKGTPQFPYIIERIEKGIKTNSPSYQFINQLQSKLFLTKRVRGLFGNPTLGYSTTHDNTLKYIEEQKEKYKELHGEWPPDEGIKLVR